MANLDDVPQRVPIRDYFDMRIDEMDKRNQQRFEAQESAIAEYKGSSEKRLESMNEFRGTVSDVIGKCITRQEAIAMTLAACAITGAIMGIVSFFMRK